MSREKIIERIKKVLALGKGTNFEEEAEAAMLKAQEILLSHNLSMDDVELSEDKIEKEVIHDKLDQDTTGVPAWKIFIAHVIAKNFRVTTVTQSGWYGRRNLVLIGLKQDVQVCKSVIMFAYQVFERLFVEYLNARKIIFKIGYGDNREWTRTKSFEMRNDYLDGFVSGLSAKFRKQVQEKALVLVQDALVVQDLEKMKFKTRMFQGGIRSFDRLAYEKGYEDSKMIEKDKYIS